MLVNKVMAKWSAEDNGAITLERWAKESRTRGCQILPFDFPGSSHTKRTFMIQGRNWLSTLTFLLPLSLLLLLPSSPFHTQYGELSCVCLASL
jgi:hypothetical protein